MPNGVRLARATDTEAVASLQWSSWVDRDAAGAHATGLDAAAMAGIWREALLAPGSPYDRLVVATDDADAVVGFASASAAWDPDAPDGAAELHDLLVAPDARGRGHGSRLLAAIAQLLTEAGAVELLAWADAADPRPARFLGSAGFAPDGASRALASPSGATVQQQRLTCSLG